MKEKCLRNNFIYFGLGRLKFIGILFMFFLLSNKSYAQNGSVGIGTTTPFSNAILDVTSTTKGVLLPRLTTAQRDVLTLQIQSNAAANGLIIYNLTTKKFNFFNGDEWKDFGNVSRATAILTPVTIPANSSLTQTFPFAGATIGDVANLSPTDALPNGLMISYTRVSATDTIEIKFYNATGTAIALPSSTFQLAIIK